MQIDAVKMEIADSKKAQDKEDESFFSLGEMGFFDDGFIYECLLYCIFPWPGYEKIIGMK
jgi:hypothetical protein